MSAFTQVFPHPFTSTQASASCSTISRATFHAARRCASPPREGSLDVTWAESLVRNFETSAGGREEGCVRGLDVRRRNAREGCEGRRAVRSVMDGMVDAGMTLVNPLGARGQGRWKSQRRNSSCLAARVSIARKRKRKRAHRPGGQSTFLLLDILVVVVAMPPCHTTAPPPNPIMAPQPAPARSNTAPRAKPNLFMPNKRKAARPVAASSASTPADAAGPSVQTPPTLRALGKQRAPLDRSMARSASPAVQASIGSVDDVDLSGRPFSEYEIVSLGVPPAVELTNGVNMGADFNVVRLYQLNPANPPPNLADPRAEIYFNRQNPNDRPFAAPQLDAEKEAKRLAREELKKPVQNGPNGEWRVPVVDRDLVHQVDQRTGEKMWRVVQDPSLVAPEATKADKKEGAAGGSRFDRKRRGGGGGGRGRGDDRGGKVFQRTGNFKDSEASARNHQELNREKLPLVIQGAFPNPAYRPNEPDRTDSRGHPIPPTVEQKWVGKHQQTENEWWAALMFENGAGGQRVSLKVIDREYKFEPHRHINVPTTSYDAGQLVSHEG